MRPFSSAVAPSESLVHSYLRSFHGFAAGLTEDEAEKIAGSPRDTEGHGSHMSSITAGGLVSGASPFALAPAWPGEASLLPALPCTKCAGLTGCSDADMLPAFDDTIADDVDIISISIGPFVARDYFMEAVAIGSFHTMKHGILTSNRPGTLALIWGSLNQYFRPQQHNCDSIGPADAELSKGAVGSIMQGLGPTDVAFTFPVPAFFLNTANGSEVSDYLNSTRRGHSSSVVTGFDRDLITRRPEACFVQYNFWHVHGLPPCHWCGCVRQNDTSDVVSGSYKVGPDDNRQFLKVH
ncbi:hypothetical protein NL676_004011 [Syzygium grande]|nr:hypothetical protein NL676_004011 [Syzygium grande]